VARVAEESSQANQGVQHVCCMTSLVLSSFASASLGSSASWDGSRSVGVCEPTCQHFDLLRLPVDCGVEA